MQTHARRRVSSAGGLGLLIALFTAFAVMIAPLAAKAAPVGDASDPAITVTAQESDHAYGAYQIFKGEANGDQLSKIEWGTGVESAALLAELATEFNEVDGTENAAALASKLSSLDEVKLSKIVAKHVTGSPAALTTTDTTAPYKYSVESVEQGYYVIVDTDTTTPSAVTSPILKVVGPVSVDSKSSAPSHDKKVKENTPRNPEDVQPWNDDTVDPWGEVADYQIGEAVPFALHGTLPSNYADFDTYKYGFIDTLSKAFDDPDNIKVFVDDVELPKVNDAGENNYTIEGPNPVGDSETGHYAGGKTFSVNFANLKKAAPQATKDSTIRVEYTAKLNKNAEIDDKGNGNKSKVYYQKSTNEGDGETGETPEDNTWVFTYTVDSNKIDAASGDELSGAKFVLKHVIKDKEWRDAGEEFAQLDADGKVTGWVADQDSATVVESKAGEKFAFKGLDSGRYELVEVEAPAGYNLPDGSFGFNIAGTIIEENDLGKLTNLQALTDFGMPNGDKGIQGDVPTATLSMTITNSSSSDLPSTGGMGTVLFTAGGLAVMLLAGFGIVARNRKRAEA